MTDPVIRFGAAYYAEYQPTPRIDEDLDLMADAGFTVIRVGESVWSTWEPEPGRFDLDWLQPVLDGAHARGIGVVIGTPSYAVPPWMPRLHPEIAGEPATGAPMSWGGRQEMDFTNPTYLFYVERVSRLIIERYRDHPAVIGWQVDNEPGLHLLHNTGVFQRFVDWLRHRYGDVETLNREWGLVYWSHRLSTWADLWIPDRNFQPQYALAWRRFQSELVTEFIGWQSDLVRSLAKPEQFITTCISYDQPGIEDVELSSTLDIASGNAYYESQDSLEHPSTDERSDDWIVKGTWAVTHLADVMWSSKQAPFLVTETNASSIGFSSLNFSPYDGQWRQIAWALVGRGARMIEYWHWHTLHFGAETYWGGVLPHSQRPGRTYRELSRIGAELQSAGSLFADAEPEFDVTVLYDSDSKFAMASQAPFTAPGQYFDPDSYRRLLAPFVRGVFDAGLQSRLVRPAQLFGTGSRQSNHVSSEGTEIAAAVRDHPVLLIPGFFTAGDDEIDWLRRYAEAGGHLVLGPRSVYADREGRARTDVQPAGLAEAAGAWYDEFATLAEPVAVSGVEGALPLDGASATLWIDGLTLDGAEALAHYDHPHFGRWPVVTTKRVGDGRITIVGTVPDQNLARELATWLSPASIAGWRELPDSVTVSTSRDASGARVHIVHNWGWKPRTAAVPFDLADALSGETLAAGTELHLGAWDVRILAQSAPHLEEKATQ